MKRYKIITQKDKWFSGRFDPEALEKLLNELSQQGWSVVSMVTASREGLMVGGGKDELIVLLEQDVPAAEVPVPRPISKGVPDADGVYRL